MDKVFSIMNCLVYYTLENHIEDFGDFPVYGANGICGYTVNSDFKEPAILIVKDGSGVGNVRFVNGKYSVIGTQNILKSVELPYKHLLCLQSFVREVFNRTGHADCVVVTEIASHLSHNHGNCIGGEFNI